MGGPSRDSGLRGKHLKTAMVALLVIPSFLLFGYCNGSTGGILGLETFNKVGLKLRLHASPRRRGLIV